MPDFHAQITLKTTDANPANYVVNNLYVGGSGDIASYATGLTAAYKAFYDAVRPYYPIEVAQNGHIIKYYDLPGAVPNYPILETTFNLTTAPTGAGLPSEVASCLSFQGARQAGFPQARRRGRIYLGPLLASVNSAGRPAAGFRTAIAAAATTLRTTISGLTTNPSWVVWSPTNGSSVPVTNGWIDDSFDIQRRRGLAYTSRTVWPP